MSVEWQSRPSRNVGRDHVFLRLKPLITEELAQLREAVFSYPEEGGAPPRLFREAAMSNRLEADTDIALMPKPHQQSHEVISLE